MRHLCRKVFFIHSPLLQVISHRIQGDLISPNVLMPWSVLPGSVGPTYAAGLAVIDDRSRTAWRSIHPRSYGSLDPSPSLLYAVASFIFICVAEEYLTR
jgi:hypothetical protein